MVACISHAARLFTDLPDNWKDSQLSKEDAMGKTDKKEMKANAEHFFKAFEHCLKCKMTKQQAMVMSKGFSKRGLIDAAEGCTHYAMRLMQ